MATESAANIKLSSSLVEGSLKKRLSIDWAVLSPVANAALASASLTFLWVTAFPVAPDGPKLAEGKLVVYTWIG